MLKFLKLSSVRILQLLSAGAAEPRKWAKAQLRNHQFSLKDLPLIYAALQKNYADDQEPYFSTRSSLFQILWNIHNPSTPGFIQNIYPMLPQNPDIILNALRVLSEINTAESINTLLDILINDPPDLKHSAYTLLIPFEKNPQNAKLLFPRLFELLPNEYFRYPIYYLAIHYRDEGELTIEDFQNFRDAMIADLTRALKQRDSAPNDSEAYTNAVDMITVIVDCLGVFPDEEIKHLLKERLNDPSSKVVLCSVLSLLRAKYQVSDSMVSGIAANPPKRTFRFDPLKQLTPTHFIPKK